MSVLPVRTFERQLQDAPRAPGAQHAVRDAGAAGPDRATEITLDLVTTRAGFDALETSWNDLFARAGRDIHMFQTFNWLWHWANHFLPEPGAAGPQLAIVTGRVDGRLVMVWPLVLERIGMLKRLSWMGEPVSQYGDVLIDDVPDARSLLRSACDLVTRRTGASVMQLRKVREDSAIAPLLAEMNAMVTAELAAPYLDLVSAPTFAVYEGRYSNNARRKRTRLRRKLAERGALATVCYTDGAEAEGLAAETFALKRRWLHERGLVSPALSDPRTAAFFADATRAASHPAGCHVMGLVSAGRPVALEIGVRCKGRTATHVIAYDLEFEKSSVGALLMEDSIRGAFADGMAVFDLLAPGDRYKLEWADAAVAVRDWALPVSFAGRLYAVVYIGFAKTALKRGVEALPIGLRRGLSRMLAGQSGD
ncbi:GNAT family N-acetyltransferase [Hyphomicrobium sp.]|uniref:GNAT family N-acetyltransferase n=1 Tax=Hyphomicrobium sp. TaxID=82 RepID=UPI0025C00534|nr:GNAT family N-acetyltransferase [Hyphomicrobium sp.]MCC7252162.1 GNAT family N-acetyltransferase [Hyphomicrobium sp.]